MLKRYLWAGIVAVLAVTLVGSSTATPGKSDRSAGAAQVLRISIGAEPPSLDPGLATDTTSANIILNIMEPLIKLGPSPGLKPLPGAAQSWSVRGRTVTLNLRRNVRWTNGQPVTANDYVWAWLRTISPQLASDYAYQFYGIVGAEAYNHCNPDRQNCNTLRARVGVRAIGRYRLRVQLTSPQPWFISQLSHHSFLPVHRATVQRFGNRWTEPRNIVTNGPFRLAAWRHDASLTLVKNTRWRNARSVRLVRIEHPIITEAATAENAFRAGNIHVNTTGVVTSNIPQWKRTRFWKVYTAIGTYYYGFNVRKITNVNQRRAMALAIDRYQITRYITQAGQRPAKGFTPISISGGPSILRNATMPAKARVAQARTLMRRVANPRRNIRLYHNNSPAHARIATAVQAMWRQLGLDTTIRAMEWGQYLQFLGPPPNADVDVYRLGWIYDFADAYNGLVLWTCGSGNNNTNWCNRRFDALIRRAERTPNFAKRVLLYRQAENLISGPRGEFPLAPIYYYVYTALVRPNVKGFFITATDQWDYTKVRIT